MIAEGWRDARRVLLVRLDNLGDLLVTTPAIHAVRESLNDTHITLLCSPVGAQVGELNPDVDDLIVYEAPWMDPWSRLELDPERERRIVAEVERGRFDAAIIFTSFRQSSLPAAYICYLAGIPLRLAASVEGSGSLLTTRHKHESDYTNVFPHEVYRSLDLVKAVGMDTDNLDLRLSVPQEARATAGELIASVVAGGHGPVVVLHPGCSMPARTYPAAHFRDVVEILTRDLDAKVLVTGTESERELAEYVAGSSDNDSAIPLAGSLPFPVLCALIEAADVTVCSNTGPMHISAAVHTPVVTAFALTNPPDQWAPWHVPFKQLYHDVWCRICYNRVCPYTHECLRMVSSYEVVDAVRDLLNGGTGDEQTAMTGRGAQPVAVLEAFG